MGRAARQGGGTKPAVSTIQAFRRGLLSWYGRARRDLPWRRTSDPYAIWISETMLQQTRVEAVIPRYESFLSRFPTVHSLAAASRREVMAEWAGLGYYRRAENLHRSARELVRMHEGRLPAGREELLAMPGVGAYTAHALLSIAFGFPFATVDGNVVRILSRLWMLDRRPARDYQERADLLLDRRRPGEFNQAMMELGATVCLPREPACGACPVERFCGARRAGRTGAFPPPASRPAPEREEMVLWILRDPAQRYWLERREISPLKGLWHLPWRPWKGGSPPARNQGIVLHAIMSRRYLCYLVPFDRPPDRLPGTAAGDGAWFARDAIAGLPRSSLLEKALNRMEEAPRAR